MLFRSTRDDSDLGISWKYTYGGEYMLWVYVYNDGSESSVAVRPASGGRHGIRHIADALPIVIESMRQDEQWLRNLGVNHYEWIRSK